MSKSHLQVAMEELASVFQKAVPLEALGVIKSPLTAFSDASSREKLAKEMDSVSKKALSLDDSGNIIRKMISDISEGAYFAKDYLNGPASNAIANVDGSDDGTGTMTYLRILFTPSVTADAGRRKYFLKDDDITVMVRTNDDVASHINVTPDAPDRYTSPTIAAFLVPHTQTNYAATGCDVVELFANTIPSVEMSRCVPYVRLNFISLLAKDDADESPFGLTRFLGMNTRSTDGIGLGFGSVLAASGDDAAGGMSGISALDPLQSTSSESALPPGAVVTGMEIFTSPQTLVNANAGGFDGMGEVDYGDMHVIDRFRPLMSLQNIRISVFGADEGGLADVKVNAQVMVHDRARLYELGPLVDIGASAYTLVDLSYGWTHPDGGLGSNNPYGKFLNALKTTLTLRLIAPNITLREDGQIMLDLEMQMRADAATKDLPATAGSVIPSSEATKIIERFAGDAADSNTSNKKRDKKRALSVFMKKKAKVKNEGSPTGTISREVWSSTVSAQRMPTDGTPPTAASETFSQLKTILQQNLDPAAIKDSIQTSQSIFSAKITELQATSENDLFFKYAQGLFTELNAKTSKTHLSLGKLLTSFLAYPAASVGSADEIQIFFYPINEYAGRMAGRLTCFMPLPFDLLKGRLEKLYKENPQMGCKSMMGVIIKELINTPYAPAWGLSNKYDMLEPSTDDGATAQAPNMEVSDEIKTKLKELYADRLGKELKFQLPSIQIYMETLPAKTLNTSKDVNLLVGGDFYKKDRSKMITRIHVYDANYSPHGSTSTMLSALEEGKLTSIMPGGTLVPPKTAAEAALDADTILTGDSGELIQAALDQGIIRLEQVGDDSTLILPDSGIAMSRMKSLISQYVPTIKYGTEASIIKSVRLSATIDSDLRDAILMDMAKENSGDGTQEGSTSNLESVELLPGQLRVQMLGCPNIMFGSQYFFNFHTGTSMDNIYGVKSIVHSISPGNFTTDLTLAPHNTANMKPIRQKLDELSGVLDKAEANLP